MPAPETTSDGLGEQNLELDQFAARLLDAAVAPHRLADLVGGLIGDQIRFGPLPVGPGGLASAVGRGRCHQVTAERGTELGEIDVRVPLSLRVTVRLPVRTVRFRVEAIVRLHLRVTPRAPLAVNVDIAELTRDDVVLRLHMSPVIRVLTGAAVDVEALLVRYICEFVRDLVNAPETQRFTRIDLGAVIDRAWDHGLVARKPAHPVVAAG